MAGSRRAAGGGRRKNQVAGPPANTRKRNTLIAPPKELVSDAALEMWFTQSHELSKRGSLTVGAAPLLLIYCNAFHWMLEADRRLIEDGLTVAAGESSIKAHPSFATRNQVVTQMARIGSLLGLDPLSTLRSNGPPKPGEQEANEFDRF
jgi:P27 family predicted phage terminase small subunit